MTHNAENDPAYPEGWVRKPWPENRYPTADEWIDWFLTAPRDQQQAEISMHLADTQRAVLCLMLHPQTDQPHSRREVLGYVRRLIDYGKGYPDAEFDSLTLGEVADRIIACVIPPAERTDDE